MKVNIMPCRYPLKDNEWPMLLKKGIESHGDSASFSQNVNEDDAHVFWGIRRPWGLDAIRKGKQSLVIERAYLGDRFRWHALGLNGLNGFADFCNDDVPDDRWRKYWASSVKEWSHDRGYALIIGQVPGDAALRGINIYSWAESIAPKAKQIYGRVLFRPHPLAKSQHGINGAELSRGDLHQAMSGAAVVITYNSNTAVDAVMAGVPAMSFDRGSMAWGVTSHDFDSPLFVGDRSDWGRKIAYAQWLPEELESGEAWAHVRGHISGRV